MPALAGAGSSAKGLAATVGAASALGQSARAVLGSRGGGGGILLPSRQGMRSRGGGGGGGGGASPPPTRGTTAGGGGNASNHRADGAAVVEVPWFDHMGPRPGTEAAKLKRAVSRQRTAIARKIRLAAYHTHDTNVARSRTRYHGHGDDGGYAGYDDDGGSGGGYGGYGGGDDDDDDETREFLRQKREAEVDAAIEKGGRMEWARDYLERKRAAPLAADDDGLSDTDDEDDDEIGGGGRGGRGGRSGRGGGRRGGGKGKPRSGRDGRAKHPPGTLSKSFTADRILQGIGRHFAIDPAAPLLPSYHLSMNQQRAAEGRNTKNATAFSYLLSRPLGKEEK
eukprot:g2947.t1